MYVGTLCVFTLLLVLAGCKAESSSGGGSADPLWEDDVYEFLRTSSASEYDFVRRHVSDIREVGGDRTSVNVFSGVVFVSPNHRDTGTVWMASVLVHEAEHIRLYRAGYAYYGQEAELICIARQERYLRSIGRNDWANYLAQQDGLHYL